MSNPAPVLRLRGTVHSVDDPRTVAPIPAQPAQYNEAGVFIRAAREAAPGYVVHDVTVLTEGGGFAALVIKDEALELARQHDGFAVPKAGDVIDVPVFVFDQWRGDSRRYRVKAFSLAGSVYAAVQPKASGSRIAAAS